MLALFVTSDGPERAERFARHWQAMVPGTQFLGVELADADPNPVALRGIVLGMAEARGLSPGRILLLGLGKASWLAVEMVLRNVLPVAGVLAYDIPLPLTYEPFPSGTAALRLVQEAGPADPDNTEFRAFIRRLQRLDVDVRAVILPADSLWTGDLPMRAGTSFLVELVAKATDKPR